MSPQEQTYSGAIVDLFERLVRGEDCEDWAADKYVYCGAVSLRKKGVTVLLFNDCDVADYIEEIRVGGRTVYAYSLQGQGGEEWGASEEWLRFGSWQNRYLAEKRGAISRSLFGRYRASGKRDISTVKVRYLDDSEMCGAST